MWKIIGCNLNFSYDESQMICNNAVNIMTGSRDELIQFVCLMNSKLFNWYLKCATEAEVQGGGIQLYVTTLEKTLVKLDFNNDFTKVAEMRINGKITDQEIDECIFNVYGLSNSEKHFISTIG